MATSSPTIPNQVTIPPPTLSPTNHYWIPSVNQFILMPAQGRLDVYYVGMFSNTSGAKETKILLPFPENAQHIDFYNNSKIQTVAQGASHPVVTLNLQNGINQIKGQFSLPAPYGNLKWKAPLSSDLHSLPGVTLIIMPQHEGILRNILNQVTRMDNINVWPARVVNIPQNFRYFLGPDPLAPKENPSPNSNDLSVQLVGIGQTSTPYPEFNVTGIVPDRFPICTLAIFFACILFIVAGRYIFKHTARA